MRFQKGASGNPKGRPRGSRNIARQYAVEAEQFAPRKEGADGNTPLRSKLDTMIANQVDKATEGDPRATEAVLARVEAWHASSVEQQAYALTSADREIIAEIYRRLAPETSSAPFPPAKDEEEEREERSTTETVRR